MRRLLILGWLVPLLGACDSEAPLRAVTGEPVVTTLAGTFTGRRSTDHEVAEFLGVPFALPPVGERRWAPPQPLPGPLELKARGFAPACMQGEHIVGWYQSLVADFGGDPDSFEVPEFSEDCLYLNIWSPDTNPDQPLPVLVWVHGGSHLGGWAYEPNYIGAALAARGAVVVTIAYRVGIFGFFSHPEQPVSNFGLLDTIAALEWVQDNIQAFGGDTGSVTVFGESAGAASIVYLMASPLAEGLMQRVAHQSAGFQFLNSDRRADFVGQAARLEAELPGEARGLDTLRAASAEAILAASAKVFGDYQPTIVIGDPVLPRSPGELLAEGRLHEVDLLIGSNRDEWLMYLDPDSDVEDLNRQLGEYGLSEAAELPSASGEDAGVLRQLDRLITAHEFVCPSLQLADAVVTADKQAWVYFFDRVRPGEQAAAMGAYHGAEIPYIFNTHDDWLPTGSRDRALGERLADYWIAFARSGNPNHDGALRWPAYRTDQPQVLSIGDTLRSGVHPEQVWCRLFAAGRSD